MSTKNVKHSRVFSKFKLQPSSQILEAIQQQMCQRISWSTYISLSVIVTLDRSGQKHHRHGGGGALRGHIPYDHMHVYTFI